MSIQDDKLEMGFEPRDGYEGTDGRLHSDVAYRRLDSQQSEDPSDAIDRTLAWLAARQQPDGHWVGELEGDTILESETILLLAFLGQEKSELACKLAHCLYDEQLPEGGWALYPGGQVDVSGSTKAYFALKLAGYDADSHAMRRARDVIRHLGGAYRVNSFTRFYLALLGQLSWDHCPAVPAEVMLLPKWAPINIYRVSAWSRTILVPLTIISASRPVRDIPQDQGIQELFIEPPDHWPPLRCPGKKGGTGPLSWDRFFRVIDRAIKYCQRHNLVPFRQRGIDAAKRWMLERFDQSDGLGAIYPPIVWSIIALDCLGYTSDSPEMQYCRQQLDDLVLEASGKAWLQPCKSPVWDTSIALRAFSAGAAGATRECDEAARWLLSQEIRTPGDWSETVNVDPSGWCFEYRNRFYPDVDDTAMVLIALGEHFGPATEDSSSRRTGHGHLAADADLRTKALASGCRALHWALSMQNRDGGWGAFDRDNDREFLCHVPFADHNAMIDPSTPDVTGRMLEALGQWRFSQNDVAVRRAVRYLRQTQEPDGAWPGRWGVNYIYGTWQVLTGLAAVGLDARDSSAAAAARWLRDCQQPCGGWGESADSYAHPELRGQGPVTASQTAWALLGLIAAGYESQPFVQRGIEYLLSEQRPDGSWDESHFTGTGFPLVFYLRYHLYPVYFPLLAISQYRQRTQTHRRQSDRCSTALADAGYPL